MCHFGIFSFTNSFNKPDNHYDYKKQELLNLHEYPGSSPQTLVGSVLPIALVFCVMFLFCSSLLCALFPMLPLSMDYPFLIVPFSKVYLLLLYSLSGFGITIVRCAYIY